jgi:DNA adenine methylase
MKPFVKWQGGKAQLLGELKNRFPATYKEYYEPFIGGGALMLDIANANPHINDFNTHLVNVYRVFAGSTTDFALFKSKLKDLETQFNALTNKADRTALYKQYRDLDKNTTTFAAMSSIDQAVRFVFLNKTGYNGRYRENSKGEFNIPYGGYESITLVNTDFDVIHNYFVNNSIDITSGDFLNGTVKAKAGDFVYMDPPYDPIVDTELNYTKEGFSRQDQKRVRDEMDRLSNLGVYCMASNHNTDYVNILYAGYNIEIVQARRSINVDPSKRGKVDEVIIRNYGQNGVIIIPPTR